MFLSWTGPRPWAARSILPFYLTPGILREADPVGRSDAFETRGDIDAERAFVVGAGQARTADDIGDEDRGELADFRH